MGNVTLGRGQINLQSRFGYIDTAIVKVAQRLDVAATLWLTKINGAPVTVLRDKERQEIQPNDPRYAQILLVQRPSAPVSQILDEQGARLDAAHFAIDLTFASEQEKCSASAFIRQHAVKLYHRPKQKIVEIGATWYSGHKGLHRQVLSSYDDKPCRIDRSEHCLHVEYALCRRSVLRGYGIESCSDLGRFDQARVWAKNWRFQRLNEEALGYRWRKAFKKLTTARPFIDETGRNFDRSLGHLIARGEGVGHDLVQRQKDVLGPVYADCFDIGKCFEEVDLSGWLPVSYL